MHVSCLMAAFGALYLRWREMVKGQEEHHEPGNGVNGLDGELGGGEEEREERDMAGDGQRSESTQISAVGEGNEAEWDDDQENRFFVHMPAEEKRRITTKGDGTDECIPSWLEEEFDETNLQRVIFCCARIGS